MLENIIKNFEENIQNKNLGEYLMKPFKEGKHYLLGDFKELMNLTGDLDTKNILEIISEKNIPINEDCFTLQGHPGIKQLSDGLDISDSSLLISLRKISQNFILVMLFMETNGILAMCPALGIVSTGFHELNNSYEDFSEELSEALLKDGTSEDFVIFLSLIPELYTCGDCFIFLLEDTESPKYSGIDPDDLVNDIVSIAIDPIYRLLLMKGKLKEVKKTPNMKLNIKDLPDLPGDQYLIKNEYNNGYLGYSNK